jgi:threonine/homoserine efflux transporter RhtA
MAPLSDVYRANRGTFNKLFGFSACMFASALGAFYAVSSERVGSLFAATSAGRDVAGAVAAVIVTNIVIACYVVMAFNEGVEDSDNAPPPTQRRRGARRDKEQ